LGGLLGYNQIETPISISNYNIEHKYEFQIFSNNLSDSFITLSQGINSYFEQGGISGVIFVFVYLPTDLSLTENFHKFQLKIRLQTSRKQKTKAVNCEKKKKILLKRDENKSMKRKICDPCHEK
jgi:hypothetical protein